MLDKETIEKLELEEDDVVIFELPEDTPQYKVNRIKELIGTIKRKKNLDNPFLLLVGRVEIDKLPEEAMNKHGWYKLTEEEKELLGKVE